MLIYKLRIVGFELYKILVIQKGYIFVLILTFLVGNYYSSLTKDDYIRNQDKALNQLYHEYGGVLDEAKVSRIEEVRNDYEVKEIELKKSGGLYREGNITKEDYYEIVSKYSLISEDKRIFEEFYKHYQTRTSDYLVYPSGYQALFSMNSEGRDFRNSRRRIA